MCILGLKEFTLFCKDNTNMVAMMLHACALYIPN